MKTFFMRLLIAGIAVFLMATTGLTADSTDQKEIKKAIITGYIEGIITEGDVNKVRKYWHEDCDIVILRGGRLNKLPAKYWLKRLTQKPDPLETDVKYEIKSINITGYAATVAIKVFYKGKPKYMDYLSLYKFEDGWKIATKIFYEYRR